MHAYLGLVARQINLIEKDCVYVLPSFLALKWERGDYHSWIFRKVMISTLKYQRS